MLRSTLIFIILFDIFLGIYVYLQDRKSKNNQLFFFLALLASFWSLTNYMTSVSIPTYWLKTSYALGSLLIFTSLMWVSTLTKKRSSLLNIRLLAILSGCFAVCSYIPGFIVKSGNQLYSSLFLNANIGWGLPFFTLYYLTVSFLILSKLYFFQKDSLDRERRLQARYILVGAFSTLLVTIMSSFILPIFSIFPFGSIDSLGFLVFLILITFAITKHNLFNIKIISLQLVVFSLWCFLLLRTFMSENVHEFLMNLGIFVVIFILTLMLVRSILQNIKHRQEIKELIESVSGVYLEL